MPAHKENRCELRFMDPDGHQVGLLRILAEKGVNTVQILEPVEAREFGEEPIQLLEGFNYEYELINTKDPKLRVQASTVVIPSRIRDNRTDRGRIEPKFHTGVLPLVLENEHGSPVAIAAVEVRSSKLNYREDYRGMMAAIAEKSTDLLMQLRAPLQTRFLPDPGRDPHTIQQRFAFLKALLTSREFREALQRILNTPHQRLVEDSVDVDVRRGFRPDSRSIGQIAAGQPRIPLPADHPLHLRMRQLGITAPSLPSRIQSVRLRSTLDTVENRFVKHTLSLYVEFLTRMERKVEAAPNSAANRRLRQEIVLLRDQLSATLSQDFFREISEPTILPLGSPVLQRKAGYREVLQAWLRFNLAAKLIWQGGDDVYGAGKRDMAVLYEYWLFFVLLGLLSRELDVRPPSVGQLIEKSADGLSLRLKSGRQFAFEDNFSFASRALRFRFTYNRTFAATEGRAQSGSWTRRMRPDFTLSIWPVAFSEVEAERQELMVHIHFDAKYRAESIEELFGKEDDDTDAEKAGERAGTFKRADLLKMHTYRDAIRRTEGSYVLYPGTQSQTWIGFHEVLPGIGAFAVRPDVQGNAEGLEHIANFIRQVLNHLCDRATRREQLGYHLYRIQSKPAEYRVTQPIPEEAPATHTRVPPLAEELVLLGWYGNEDQRDWVRQNRFYAIPLGTSVQAARVPSHLAQVRYLLLNDEHTNHGTDMWSTTADGIRMLTGGDLLHLQYPFPVIPNTIYGVYDLEPAPGFLNWEGDLSRFPDIDAQMLQVAPLAALLDEGWTRIIAT